LLKARTVEPEKQLLLTKGSETTEGTDKGTTSVDIQNILNSQEQMAAARKRLGKQVPAATEMRMNGVVCAGRAEELKGRKLGQPSQLSMGGCEDEGQLEKL
jgi:hypothetical protein